MKLRWIKNVFDPNIQDEGEYVGYGIYVIDEEYQRETRDLIVGKIIDEPQKTSAYTVEQWKEMHYVGVYVDEEEYKAKEKKINEG
jgi:hypothetical protein